MALWLKLFFVLLLAGLWFWLTRDSLQTAPFLPSSYRDIDRALKLADVGPEDTVLDLGSGTGKAVLRAHKKYGARARGVELVGFLHGLARLRFWWAGSPRDVSLHHGDLFEQDLEDVDVVYIYALGDTLEERVAPWLREEAPEGLRVVSNHYLIAGLDPAAVRAGGPLNKKTYLYQL